MFPPNGGFLPSSLSKRMEYDEEGRLLATHHGGHGDNPALGQANSLFATDAEIFGNMPPFLKESKRADARRRNYVIQPGGACLYFETDPQLKEPWDHNRVQFTAPSDRETFGHNSLDGTKMGGNTGRAITVGGRSGSTGGR